MKKMFFAPISVLIFLLLVGCAHKPVASATALTLSEFWKDQKGRIAKSARFSGKIALRFESKSEKISGSGRVVGWGEKRTRLELRDPLGRTAYLLVQVPGAVSIYVPSSKVRYEDRQDGRLYFKKTIGQTLSTLELRRLWLGIAPLAQGVLLDNWHWDYSGEGFRAWKRGPESTVELLLDGDCGAIKEMKVVTKEGAYLAEYSEFEETGGVHVAHVVKLTLLSTNEKILLEWDRLDWGFDGDPKGLHLLDVGEGTQTIILR